MDIQWAFDKLINMEYMGMCTYDWCSSQPRMFTYETSLIAISKGARSLQLPTTLWLIPMFGGNSDFPRFCRRAFDDQSRSNCLQVMMLFQPLIFQWCMTNDIRPWWHWSVFWCFLSPKIDRFTLKNGPIDVYNQPGMLIFGCKKNTCYVRDFSMFGETWNHPRMI